MHSRPNIFCKFSFLEQKSESKIFWILILTCTFNFAKVNGTHLQQFITRTTLFSLFNFSLSFFYFPSLSFVPYFFSFFSFFDVFPIFSLSFFYLWKSIFIFSFCIKELRRFTQIMTNSFLYFFLLHCSNFIKMCARRCAQIITNFLLVDINLNHNVIFYFFITSLILYW